MVVIAVCVGSACHLRGSYSVIQRLEELIETHQLSDRVELRANFCMENCSCGTSVRIGDDNPITVPDIPALDALFDEQVLPLVGRSNT